MSMARTRLLHLLCVMTREEHSSPQFHPYFCSKDVVARLKEVCVDVLCRTSICFSRPIRYSNPRVIQSPSEVPDVRVREPRSRNHLRPHPPLRRVVLAEDHRSTKKRIYPDLLSPFIISLYLTFDSL